MAIKLFDRWDTSEIKVTDQGLVKYINLKPIIVPKSFGRAASQQFHKSQDMNIIERLMNHLHVSGHKGKRHYRTSGQFGGKSATAWIVVKDMLAKIEKKTTKNPMEVLVKAIENSAIKEEVSSFQLGSIMARKAVISSPQRRVDIALRCIVQGSFHKAAKSRKPMADVLAEELIAAYNNDATNSHAIKEKERIEREASGAR